MWHEEVKANQPCWAPEKQTNISQKLTLKKKRSQVVISQNVLQIYLYKYFTEDLNFV